MFDFPLFNKTGAVSYLVTLSNWKILHRSLLTFFDNLDTVRKLNLHKTPRTSSECLVYIQFCPISKEKALTKTVIFAGKHWRQQICGGIGITYIFWNQIRDHSFSAYAKKQYFVPPDTHTCVRIRGWRMSAFRKTLRTH